ncbi:MAG TPA: glycosyl transferase family 2 [Opitutaceae bacterium]|nr:glycosyl transferase family 2 [Opitutaceae bacterium]HPO00736.1 glycosyl transferase family 2 [Opitutaceae bacterium]
MITPGRLLYLSVHRPLEAIKTSWREGGPLEQWKTERGRREMVKYAEVFPPLRIPTTGESFAVHMLTGKRFWYQSAFCLHSLARVIPGRLVAYIYDDGTLDEAAASRLSRLGIDVRIYSYATLLQWLDARLPVSRYPFLRQRWGDYPIIRKLIATHIRPDAQGWQLIIDSDLLFFREPTFIINWLRAPDRPFHAVDVETSYGYSLGLLNSITPAPVKERVNAGLYGLNSDTLDWDFLEKVAHRLWEAEGPKYFFEQAILAILVAGLDCAIAPEADYITLPRLPEARDCHAVMHHYVAHSKRWYFRHNWRRVVTISA